MVNYQQKKVVLDSSEINTYLYWVGEFQKAFWNHKLITSPWKSGWYFFKTNWPRFKLCQGLYQLCDVGLTLCCGFFFGETGPNSKTRAVQLLWAFREGIHMRGWLGQGQVQLMSWDDVVYQHYFSRNKSTKMRSRAKEKPFHLFFFFLFVEGLLENRYYIFSICGFLVSFA